ncbi:SSI family serine proteinase inhibitor [Streptomyces sp. NPDC021093]|uniref:SSI family serine proteinase inhibitor n=1 Tax=Streptomyces sp. NPDC021093 TaxID=3365112 RepID=UPI0037A49900
MSAVRTAVRTAGRQALVAAAAAAALFAGAGSATAAATDQAPRPGNWLYTVVIEGDDAVGDMKGNLLRCPPPKGSGHPAAAVACKQLKAVDGDIAKIKRADVACPMIYQPVTAMSYGMWDGRRMVFAKNYPNACVMHASTGSVFKSA